MADWKAQVVGAQRGDLEAFGRVVRQFQDMAVGYAYAILQDFSLAEDAAQEAFVQAFYDLAALREPQAFPAWFRRIVFKQCDRLTRRKRLPTISLDADAELADPGQSPLEALQQRELQDAVLSAVNELPEHERAATALFYINGYSMAEVGEFLEVPVSTVKSRLHAARRRMQERMVGVMEEAFKQRAPGDEFGRRVRQVLEGVPRVGLYRGGPRPPGDDPLPACLCAYMEYASKDLPPKEGCGQSDPWHDVYIHLMGASGLAFRLLWDARGWDRRSTSAFALAADPLEPIQRTFAAAGYACTILLRQDFAHQLGLPQEQDYSEAELTRHIVASLRDRDRPVIAIGVIGPPECCLVTGYDQGGEVLLGWGFWQDDPDYNADVETESSGYFRKQGWYKDTQGVILIGDRQEVPPLRETYRRSLEFALEVMRTPGMRGVAAGQAAYTAWADSLMCDAELSGDVSSLRQRHHYHWLTVGALAEARAWAARYLRSIANTEPAAAQDLRAAAACFEAVHALLWERWAVVRRDSLDNELERFADHYRRHLVTMVIHLAQEQDERAAQHIERALVHLGGNPHVPHLERVSLEGVPRIGYAAHTCPFPGALCACMQYLGVPCDYDYLMGVTGAAFRRFWRQDDPYSGDLMALAPEPHRRAFEALHYEVQTVSSRDRGVLRQTIKNSIFQGRPVLAFGLLGRDCGVITGYDRGGEVLIGYSYAQDAPMPGYIERADWSERMERSGPYSLILIGYRWWWAGQPLRQVLRDSLTWAVDLAHKPVRPERPGYVSGLAAYEAWAEGLEADAGYPHDSPEILATQCAVHREQTVMLEERHSAAAYLRSMATAIPEVAACLTAAAVLYDEVAGEAVHIWPWGYGSHAEVGQALMKAETRREIAGHIRVAREKEGQALAQLERAVATLLGNG